MWIFEISWKYYVSYGNRYGYWLVVKKVELNLNVFYIKLRKYKEVYGGKYF